MKLGLLKKFIFLSVLLAITVPTLLSISLAQPFNSPYNSQVNPSKDYFKNRKQIPPNRKTDSIKQEQINQFPVDNQKILNQENGFAPQNNISPISSSPLEKKITEIPYSKPASGIDASDLKDPLLSVRGMDMEAEKVLKPGTTIDGIRFFSSGKTQSFIETEYRKSNFKIEDVYGRVVAYDKGQRCLTCHGGIEEISSNHRFSCTRCHGGNGRAYSKKSAHKKMVSNPSDLNHAPKYCGKCHADHIDKVSKSSMATSKGQINLTRYNWGIQNLASPTLSLIPDEEKGEKLFPPEVQSEGQPELVDDFLQKKCLRCHIQSPSPHRAGEYRATGCASCHMLYANDGMSITRDRAIQTIQRKKLRTQKKHLSKEVAAKSFQNSRGYPILHKFSVAIPSSQCETCHHESGPGLEYEGLFKKPARKKPLSNTIDKDKPVLFGSEHKFLIQDIHRERGMHCIDCHEGSELKNPYSTFPKKAINPNPKCENCHGTHEKEPGEFLLLRSLDSAKEILKKVSINPNLKGKIKFGDLILRDDQGKLRSHIKKQGTEWILISKVTGKKHAIPILKNKKLPVAHSLKKHMNLIECAACHARWTYSEWGNHVILDNRPNLQIWRDWSFADPNLQQTLFGLEKTAAQISYMNQDFNWLTASDTVNGISGRWQPGVWIKLLSKATWDKMLLGKNSKGKYSILKPKKQYFISEISSQGETLKSTVIPSLQNGNPGLIMTPYTPHTIRKMARSCESCHSNSETLGLGDPKLKTIFDAPFFFEGLTSGPSLPINFQLWQTMDSNGILLQSVWPLEARLLNSNEISLIQQTNDKYRANRYLALRERGFPKLLNRNSFPYDIRHEANKELYGSPIDNEDFLIDETSDKDLDAIMQIIQEKKPVNKQENSSSKVIEPESSIFEYRSQDSSPSSNYSVTPLNENNEQEKNLPLNGWQSLSEEKIIEFSEPKSSP
jgi:hypothetical protein